MSNLQYFEINTFRKIKFETSFNIFLNKTVLSKFVIENMPVEL